MITQHMTDFREDSNHNELFNTDVTRAARASTFGRDSNRFD